MAMSFAARIRRHLCQSIKQVSEDFLISPHVSRRKISDAVCPSSSSGVELVGHTMCRGSSKGRISGISILTVFKKEVNVLKSDGDVPSLLCRREDAAKTLRSFHPFAFAAVTRSPTSELSLQSGGCILPPLAFSAGGRLRSVIGNNSYPSVVDTRPIEQQFWSRKLVFRVTTPHRSLSSQTWADKFKNAINLNPKRNTGVYGRPREILSEVSKPALRTFSHYREAVGLQIEAFWKRNYLVVVGFVGLGVCLLLWRIMFGIASTFISLSEGMAKFGFLALAAAIVVVGGVILRARFSINPDAVYRVAMRRLNTSAVVLEVMGAPLSGTDLRAYIMSGGGFRFKNFRPRLAGKRCFIIFPIRGSERPGLVSIEVKKKKGQYNFKLLAVDVPTAGADQRLYLIGDENEYKVGGGLISELRDPIVKAMAAQKEFEDLDMEEEEDDERKALEAEKLLNQADKYNKSVDKRAQSGHEKAEELDECHEGQDKDGIKVTSALA